MSIQVELPPPPQKGLNCTTFRFPPLDGSLCASGFFDWHYKYNKNHPIFLYDDSPGVIKTIDWSELFPAIHRAGHYIRKVFGLTEIDDPNGKPVIAVLANPDTFTAITTIMGLMRIEAVSFLVSPRNSAAAVAHLLEKTGTKYMLITDDLKNLVTAAVATMENPPQIAGMPLFGDLFPQDFEDFEPLPVSKKQQLNDPNVIMHSSGSVAFPKPVVTSHLGMLLSGRVPFYGERDLTGVVLAAHAVPVFHGMGLAMLAWMVCAGITAASFKPTLPPTLPTPDLVYEGAVATKSDLIFCVPIFVEVWSRNPQRVEYFKTIQGVWYAGAPLKKSVGDVLNAQGVGIFQLYGSSEASVVTEILPKSTPKDWEYLKFSKQVKTHFIPDGFGAYELVIEATPEFRPSVVNTKIDGADAYATSDLFIPHPTIPGYWKTHGRVDDQIMHNSGEKTNPGPLEAILNADPHVQSAVIFGAGRFNAGVIIDPRPPHKFDPKEEEKLIEFRNKIWPTVEKLNEFAPQHSRIFKEMIIVSSPAKPFVYTVKMTARRQAVIVDYDQEIEAVYKAVEESAQAFTELPTAWTPESSLEFARSLIGSVLKEKVSDDDDIFQHSCDSLQATWIRNSIINALRKSTQINTREIHHLFVYQYPSVSSLARFIAQVAASGTVPVQESPVDQMLDMVSKYTKNFSVHTGSGAVVTATEDVVLITGVTGAIGSNVLAQLVKLPRVSKIFAITRKSATLSIERLKSGLTDRGLDPLVVDSSKVVVVDGDLTLPSLGLTSQLLDEIRSSVTHIFHIAWRVDFVASLPAYETDIKGLRNLIDIALSSRLPTPPRLIFTSSVAVLTNRSKSDYYFPEEFVVPEVAAGMGYGESKWISEKILSVASSQTPLRPVIVRAGQISGGVNGCWNPLEWMPAVVQSAELVKCLPSLDQQISLIPLDVAASVIVEVRNSSAELLHLTNPKPVAWNALFRDIASTLKVDLVPYSDWISRLEASETDKVGERHIAVRLLSFFKAVPVEGNTEAGGLPRLDITAARRVSPTLNDENLKPVGLEDVKKWLNYWKSAGLISF